MYRMIMGATVAFALITVTGCRERATPLEATGSQQQVATTVAPDPSIAIDEAKVISLDSQALSNASWTRHACSLDMVDRGPPEATVAKGAAHVFSGFVLNQDGEPAGDFSVLLKGKSVMAIPTATGKNRPDVAEYFKNPSLASSGFEFSTTLSGVAPGEYEVVFLLESKSGSYFCETGKKLQVTGES